MRILLNCCRTYQRAEVETLIMTPVLYKIGAGILDLDTQ